MNKPGSKWNKSTRMILWVCSAFIVLAVAAVPTFSWLIKGDFPGHETNTRAAVKQHKGNPAVEGSWASPFSIGIIPIHSVLLYNDTVLMWTYANQNGQGGILASLYNVSTGAVTVLPVPGRIFDYFCSGESQFPGGRVLLTGGLSGPQGTGSRGIWQTVIFDPSLNHWVPNPHMAYARYYPTNTQLANGNTLIFSGLNGTGTQIVPQVEEYNPTAGTFQTLPASANLPNPRDWESYPRMFLLTNGNIFAAGQTQYTWVFDPLSNTWSWPGYMRYPERHGEGAVLMPDLKTVIATGGEQAMNGTKQPPTATIESYDTSQPGAVWTYGTPMNLARHDHNLIELPDGTLLAVGGAGGALKYENPVYTPELYNPNTATWTELAPQMGSRGYHSIGILLPDGTILSAGSDSGDSLQTSGEIFSPPYLFQGARPTITSAPSTLSYGQNFTVVTPDAANITRVVLMHNDSATHADHFDQREVPLSFTIGSGQLTVTAPPSGNYAPPGYYMLFILNSSGVPAVAPILNLD